MKAEDHSEQYQAIMDALHHNAEPQKADGQCQFGIRAKNILGVTIPVIRKLARNTSDQRLAQELWDSGIHEARILATMVADPDTFSRVMADAWAEEFDSWDLVDQACLNLLWKVPFANDLALEWPHHEAEYIRRAGFSLMAVLAVHAKSWPDERFTPFFPIMIQYATDERHFVVKAINWALRQVGKSRPSLRQNALDTAVQIREMGTPGTRWIANDALKELLRRTVGK
jgi:3-methyladenine DNA glycosylase AlkD